MTIQRIPDDII